MIQWMDVSAYLKALAPAARREIVFEGEMFSAPNVLTLRDRYVPLPVTVLGKGPTLPGGMQATKKRAR
jgi:hypothetical protein